MLWGKVNEQNYILSPRLLVNSRSVEKLLYFSVCVRNLVWEDLLRSSVEYYYLEVRGWIFVTGYQIVSLGFSHWNIRKGFHTEFHQISKLRDSQPLAAKPTAKYHIRVVFSIKLLLKLIWLKVSSAFNLGQRQQWNFPSLSCGAWHQHLSGSFQQRS